MNLKNEQLISSQVRSIVADALNLEFDEISLKSSKEEFPEWDSMTYLTIVSNIEDEFDISISGENIDKFGSIPQIINEINKWRK
tara:strand:- start:396 stop:647 length:252 start_codon:yes stop_codon:yes gene_type:complete